MNAAHVLRNMPSRQELEKPQPEPRRLRTFRVNTPGPSFTVVAYNLDEATSRAATGLPLDYPHQSLTQNDTFSPRWGMVRRVAVWNSHPLPITGFSIHEEL